MGPESRGKKKTTHVPAYKEFVLLSTIELEDHLP
jgi:hypothetical protein